MTAWPWVAVGGALGAVARYGLSTAFAGTTAALRFPWPTLGINVAGCFLIGLVAALWSRQPALSPAAGTFLTAGVLGGFTTFSAFGLETLAMLRRGDLAPAAGYVAASVLLGLLAVWLGTRAGGG